MDRSSYIIHDREREREKGSERELYSNNVEGTVGFAVAQAVKNPPVNAEDLGLIPGLGRSPGKGKDYPPQYFCHVQRSLVGYSWWGCKESDTAERLTHTHIRGSS